MDFSKMSYNIVKSLRTMKMVKIVVFVPKAYADFVRQAIGDAWGEKFGKYSHASFSTEGTGRFKPLKGAHPAIGMIGKIEKVVEERIECICERSKAKKIIAAIRKVHPYEEIAIDIYPLISEEEL
jgi:hypothetical protein